MASWYAPPSSAVQLHRWATFERWIMRFIVSLQSLMVCSFLGLGLHGVVLPSPALAYTGGPIEASVIGIEPVESKVFYVLTSEDESGRPPQIWYFNLKGSDPTRAIRARSLEWPNDGTGGWQPITEAWRNLSARLTPLPPRREFSIGLSLEADSVGVDSSYHTACYEGHLVVKALGVTRVLDLVMYCESTVKLSGVYEIPGRPEIVVVFSYRGRAHGCEDVDLPILIPVK